MSKETMTIEDFIHSIRSSVKSGNIEKEYPKLRKQCRDLGFSSYLLTLLIKKAKKEDKNPCSQMLFDNSFFEKKQNSEDITPPHVEDSKNEKKKSKIGMFFLLAICCIEGFLLLSLYQEKKDLTRKYSALTANLKSIYNMTQDFELVQSFSEWISNNHSHHSISQTNYYIDASNDDTLTFDCFTSSEKYDSLRITISSGNEDSTSQAESLLRAAEKTKQSIRYIFIEPGRYKLHVEYEKDGSVSSYDDKASISNIYLHRNLSKLLDSICRFNVNYQ